MSRKSLLRCVLSLLALVVWLLPVTARAQSADDHFNEGMKQMAQKDYDAACAAFERSEVPEPTMASRYQLGHCNELRGRYASSHDAYLDAAAIAEKQGDAERATVARKRARELEQRIPLLQLNVGSLQKVNGLTILDNGKPLPAARWNAPIMVDAGRHQLTFSAPGYQTVTMDVNASVPKQVVQVTLPMLQPGQDATPPVGGKSKPTALFWVGVGLTAGGGLFALLGTVDLALCSDFCAAEQQALPIAGLVLGGAMLAVGIPFMVVGRKSSSEPARTTVEALVSPTSAGMRVRF